jgi:ariadne-1
MNPESKTTSAVVACTCDRSYCFKCGFAPHVPASCEDLAKWKAKDTDDEASIRFIKATTTECPKCGIALDRYTACNHITCKCTYQFCFICKQKWGSCSVYSCSKFKNTEDRDKNSEFAPGYATASLWLVDHERYIAFAKKAVENKSMSDKVSGEMIIRMKKKSLDYREFKPGGNPSFITEGAEILAKSYRILHYTLIWGFSHIPPLLCAQKQIFEMQIKNYERMTKDLLSALERPIETIDHLKTKALYTLLENNLIKQIEESDDLLLMFSEKKTGNLSSVSVLARWTCPKEGCNYSNHPVEQAKQCLLCSTPRPEVKMSWFPDDK